MIHKVSKLLSLHGWAGGIRTHGMTESKSVALPLGDSPIWETRSLITRIKLRAYDLSQGLRRRVPEIEISGTLSVGWAVGFEPTVSRATIWRFDQLSYVHHMARQKGLEPLAYCLEGSCSIQLSYWRVSGAYPLAHENIFPFRGNALMGALERVMGIEPTRPAWKAGVLPLNYTRSYRWASRVFNPSLSTV